MIYTQFDSSYLSRGLLMIESLDKYDYNERVAVICYDDIAWEYCLEKFSDSRFIVLKDTDIDPKEVNLAQKKTRSRASYIWGQKADIALYLMKRYNPDYVVYLDADLYFIGSVNDIINKFQNSSMAFTGHDFTEQQYNFISLSETGQWSAQMVYFKNSNLGNIYARFWQSLCHAWCGDTPEAGRYGDQKYLEYFENLPEVLTVNMSRCCGPWNLNKYDVRDILCYHFHGLKLLGKGYEKGPYPLDKNKMLAVYSPYVKKLSAKNEELRKRGITSIDERKLTLKRRVFLMLNPSWTVRD